MKIKSLFLAGCSLLTLSTAPVSGQSFPEAQTSVRADLDKVLAEFAALQESIGSEKVPLANEMNALEAAVTERRREQARAQRLADSAGSSISQIETEIAAMERSLNYLNNTLNEYARNFEVAIDIAEKEIYGESIAQVLSNIEDEQMDSEAKFRAQFGLLEMALDRAVQVLGGRRFDGVAIIPGGDSKAGKFLILGPVSFFAADDGSFSGMVSLKHPIRARAVEIKGAAGGIRAAATTGTGVIPFDPTLNDALELEVSKVTFADEVAAGGIWIWPIIIAFLIAMLVAFIKAIEIYGIKLPKEADLQQTLQYLQDGQREEAVKFVRNMPGHFGKLFQSAVKHAGDSKELLEEVLYERMLEAQPQIERLLPIIAVTAATAPLLGLLGTVTGMINTFQQITLFGTSDASKLAGGISEALITTKYGLIAAIPSLVVHALLSRKAQGVIAAMEKYSSAFINGIEQDRK